MKMKDRNELKNEYRMFHEKVLQENIGKVTAYAEECMEESDVPLKIVFDFNIAIDELLSNICKYSGADNMWIGISVTDEKVYMRFENDGDRFDPNDVPEPDITADIDERSTGGLGIFMVKQLMDSFNYEYTDGKNVIEISKKFKERK